MIEDRAVVNREVKKFVRDNPNIKEIWTYDPENWDNPLKEPSIEMFLNDECVPSPKLLQDLYMRADKEREIWNCPGIVKASGMHLFRSAFKNPNYVCIYRNEEWLV